MLRFSATSPSPGASSSTAVDLVARVPSPPSRRRGRHLAPLRPGECVGEEWTPHRSDCSIYSETHGSSSSSSSSSSSNPTAALFHKLRLVPLLSGSGGILVLSHELINVKIIGLESLASGFHI